VLAYQDDPVQQKYLRYYKMGDGPLYTFYTPYHLCHLEVPISLARAVLFRDATIAPLAGPVVEVVTTAKRDLHAGEVLDGLGHYMTYGQCINADDLGSLLPIGLAEGCRLRRDVPKDELLSYSDVELPVGRLCDRLRAEQTAHFAPDRAAAIV
jgi:predicted homoserine dehydrogenase-like protein